jgi:DNA-directed RNA polymerase specialized sigma24 family protein
MATHPERDRARALTAQLPHLYALANALDANAADDLVQETLASALADPDTDTTGSVLAAALERLAAERGPDIESPTIPAAGSDPDADEAELFYPDFHTDGPDAGAWVDPPVAWGEARVLPPDDDVITAEAYGAVDAALTEIDPVDARLVTLVDIEGAPFSRAVLELGLPSDEAGYRLARARFAVRAALDRYLQG